MTQSPTTRGTPLRVRLTLWMLASSVLSLVAFAITAYIVVFLEEREELTTRAPLETPEEIASETAAEVLLAMGVAAPFALLVSMGGAVWISRRTLEPLRAVVRTADEMGARDLSRRLEVPPGDPELAEVVVALNTLFERLESGFGALERYAADASHELRTPLAVIASELEVALRHERSPAQWKQVAETALDEVRRLARLVETLLELARLDALPPDDVVVVELHEALEQVVARMAAQASAAKSSLTFGASDEAFTVWANADALASALTGLVDNALRYTHAGGEVRISLVRGSGDEAAILVDDSGPGVPEAETRTIFEPFARGSAGRAADDDADGRRGGLGLGLATARRVAELHGGSLGVGPSPLGGARFILTLPVSSSGSSAGLRGRTAAPPTTARQTGSRASTR